MPHTYYYLRQVNEVNDGDNAFVRCVSVCLSVRSGRSMGVKLNANSSKTVKATDLKFDKNVSRDSPDMTPKIFFQKGAWPGSRGPLNFSALNVRRYALSRAPSGLLLFYCDIVWATQPTIHLQNLFINRRTGLLFLVAIAGKKPRHLLRRRRRRRRRFSHRPRSVAWEIIPFEALWAGEG